MVIAAMMPSLTQTFRMTVTIVIKIEITIPISGARKIKMIVLIMMSDSIILPQLIPIPFTDIACAMAAPAKPPISV